MKNLCVFGILTTDEGMRIKSEMYSWLEPLYNIFPVEQEPPGSLYEYPALYFTIRLAIDSKLPVLYIHTKGAGHPKCHFQSSVRNMWKHEYGNSSRIGDYFNGKTDAVVTTPISGPHNITWFNSFVITPKAATILLPHFHFDSDRFYYEQQMLNIPNMRVNGILGSNKSDIEAIDIAKQF